VREILSQSTAENRRGGNLRGLSQDTELWARLELVLGRPEEAAALCRSAMDRLDRRRFQWRRGVLAVLRARALGWLERRGEAAAQLAGATPQAVAELEPEERPAVWAHAGERDAARRLAATLESPAAGLWRAVLAGDAVPAAEWQALAALEPYRAARLVFDLERAATSALLAPPDWRGAAIATFRRLGAAAMAAWLEARDAGPWQALASYAAQPAGDLQAIAALLRRAGDPDARLSWTTAGDGREASATLLPAGAGELALLVADLPAGRLELRCSRVDPALTSCFALAVRDLAAAGGTLPAAMAPSESSKDLAVPATPPGSSADEVAETSAAPATALIGSSPILRAAVARILKMAAVDIPVLIQGESGTGKELAAREIHRASARARGPFLALNCAAFAESLLFSDLFGHVRGAFTGADRDRAGVFEAARGGTVLLDEIGDLPLAAQGLLLRVVQESEVRRLGESSPRRVDVRMLAATHHDLERAVAAGTFREDLFYRLKVGAVELPPLRDRAGDVLELADLILVRQPFSPAPRLSIAARDRLRRHAWPGNIRELENVLRLAAALAAGGVIEPAHLELPDAAAMTGADGGAADPEIAAPASMSYHQQVERLRRRLLSEAIAAAGGNHAEAARRLGLSRQALSYLVRQLGLR
jgi:DNA-binding NtrC family response regulator